MPGLQCSPSQQKGVLSHSDVDKVLSAIEIAKKIDPSLQIDGELQADAALLPKVGEKKAPGSPLPERRMY